MTRLRLFSIMIVVVVSTVLFAGIARPQTALQRDRRVAVTIDDLPANMFLGDLSDWQEMTAMLLAGLVRHVVIDSSRSTRPWRVRPTDRATSSP